MRIRKGLVIAVMVTLLGATSGDCRCCVSRIGDSAQSFQHYFEALREASLNPMERLVYSLVLVRTRNARAAESGL